MQIKTEKKRLSSTIEREILVALKIENIEKRKKIKKRAKALSLSINDKKVLSFNDLRPKRKRKKRDNIEKTNH